MERRPLRVRAGLRPVVVRRRPVPRGSRWNGRFPSRHVWSAGVRATTVAPANGMIRGCHRTRGVPSDTSMGCPKAGRLSPGRPPRRVPAPAARGPEPGLPDGAPALSSPCPIARAHAEVLLHAAYVMDSSVNNLWGGAGGTQIYTGKSVLPAVTAGRHARDVDRLARPSRLFRCEVRQGPDLSGQRHREDQHGRGQDDGRSGK